MNDRRLESRADDISSTVSGLIQVIEDLEFENDKLSDKIESLEAEIERLKDTLV